MRIGDLVDITWADAGNKTNEKLSDIKHIIAKSTGRLIKEDEIYYYIQFGEYISDHEDEREIDCTLIPKGCVLQAEIIHADS